MMIIIALLGDEDEDNNEDDDDADDHHDEEEISGRRKMWSVKPCTSWGVFPHEKRLHTCNLRDPSFHTLNVSGMTYDICGYLLSDYHCRTRCSRATQWFPQSKPKRLQESLFVLIFKWNKSIALIWKGKSMMITSKIWCEVEFQQGNRKKKSAGRMFHC